MEENTIVPDKIKLFNIDVINTYINDDTITDNLNLEFSVAHNTKHNLEKERVKIELFINLLSNNDIGVKYHIDFHYTIEDLKDQYQLNKDNKAVFSGQFIATLIGISFSTARGLIFQQLQDTKFKGMILPIVSPYKMLISRNNE
ncbi:hypothetical protein LPB136_06865 [Tenacibaculum todarodis]|uniref:Preprotein translocase subunit SecB n=1 Tax=Tenacibaculum todarodis TaxID=1850252 RepID=A0A1L3JIW5_9FLAO|nr:hypothetical protein [Tenacibaculum todarodis]APG65085.1 hypothetical protein LPB136_06865 [Tenacibaculum todarodis]